MRITDWSSDVCSSDLRQLAELSELLSLERETGAELRVTVAQLSAELQISIAAREELSSQVGQLTAARDTLEGRLAELMASRAVIQGRLDENEAARRGVDARLLEDRKSTRLNSSH